ncbi:MAG: type II toxin-antitoxin system prevent-host-death family antitoxin [Firmicutes bacterium]|nr:type II toxin-antitoxin system prevent-host-death family antitoxin [Bacillota bacterium]
MEAGIREIKNRLSYFLKQVQEGKSVLIKDRNRPVARLVPVVETRNNVPEEIIRLVESGLASWNGGKPKGIDFPATNKTAILVSEMVTEDRR